MLRIIVCEDSEIQREKINNFIENTIIRENMDMELSLSTDNPKKVIELIELSSNFNGVYFLDVDLKANINGIQLAEKIREIDPIGSIIFVTTHAEMSFLTFQYKVEAMDYIIKDNYKNIKERIESCLIAAYKKYTKSITTNNKIFSIKSEDTIINIKINDILFFETSDQIHKVKVHEENRQFEFYANMKDVESKLDENFYRCHRSYIVNIKKIDCINKKDRIIIMTNGEECYISTRYLKGLIEKINSKK